MCSFMINCALLIENKNIKLLTSWNKQNNTFTWIQFIHDYIIDLAILHSVLMIGAVFFKKKTLCKNKCNEY